MSIRIILNGLTAALTVGYCLVAMLGASGGLALARAGYYLAVSLCLRGRSDVLAGLIWLVSHIDPPDGLWLFGVEQRIYGLTFELFLRLLYMGMLVGYSLLVVFLVYIFAMILFAISRDLNKMKTWVVSLIKYD